MRAEVMCESDMPRILLQVIATDVGCILNLNINNASVIDLGILINIMPMLTWGNAHGHKGTLSGS
jgi:hypothetical protein